MKSKGILNIELAKLVAETGHGDMIAIVDRGFPLPISDKVTCIDLAITKNIPTVAQVLDALLSELVVENRIFAQETIDTSKEFYDIINSMFKEKSLDVKEEIIPHSKFKKAILSGGFGDDEIRAYIRTGEFTMYGNIILVAGVDFS